VCVLCSRLAANTEEKQPVEEKQTAAVISETAGKSYLKGDARLKRRSTLVFFYYNQHLYENPHAD